MTTAARPRRWSLGALLCVCVALAACSDEPEVAEAPFTATPSSAPATPEAPDPSPTPSPESTLLAPPNEPPPPLMLTGEDFLAIRRSHEAYRDWLYSHPDDELLLAIYHPECACTHNESSALASYEESGRWWIGRPTAVLSVEVLDHLDPNLVTLRTVLDSSGGQLIDQQRVVHDELPPKLVVEDDVFVRADATAPWLLRDFLNRGPLEEFDG